MKYTLDDGRVLISLARDAIESVLNNSESQFKPDGKLIEEYGDKRGVFVTLSLNSELRGCIGFIQPIYKLYEAVIRAARLAAFNDPRFAGLTKEEYKEISVEVSILTPPKEIMADTPDDYLKNIKVRRDGLIIDNGFNSGCLLPQVPGEWNWDEKEFLENTCMKAGLHKDAWKDDNCKVLKFTAQVFSEEAGGVIEKELD